MKKTAIYLIILIVLAGGVYYIIKERDNTSTISKKDQDFAVEDISKIGKIRLADKENNVVVFEKKNNQWLLNDKYEPRKAELELLLNTIENIRVKSPVSKSARNNVIRGMSGRHTLVEVFDQKGKLIKSYFVGGVTTSGVGNYMKMKDSEHLFEVYIPGFNGHLETRYFTDEQDWRSRKIFAYEPGTIQSISVDYINRPEESFKLTVVARDSFNVEQLNKNNPANKSIDERAANLYLNHFQKIHAEAYVNDVINEQAILASEPIVIMKVRDIQGKENEIKIYSKPVSKRTKQQFDPAGAEMEYDRERFYALINEGEDWVVIQEFVFGKLFVTYSFFLEKPA